MFHFHNEVLAVESFVLGTERLEERFLSLTLGRISFQSHRHLACFRWASFGDGSARVKTKGVIAAFAAG